MLSRLKRMLNEVVLMDVGISADYRDRVERLEGKVDFILKQLGVRYTDPASPDTLSAEAKALAENYGGKISAIKLHRQQTGATLRAAKQAVEAYRASRREETRLARE